MNNFEHIIHYSLFIEQPEVHAHFFLKTKQFCDKPFEMKNYKKPTLFVDSRIKKKKKRKKEFTHSLSLPSHRDIFPLYELIKDNKPAAPFNDFLLLPASN